MLAVVYLATPYLAFAGLISGTELLADADRVQSLRYLLYAAMAGAAGLLGLGLAVLLRNRPATWFFCGTTLFFTLALLFYLLL